MLTALLCTLLTERTLGTHLIPLLRPPPPPPTQNSCSQVSLKLCLVENANSRSPHLDNVTVDLRWGLGIYILNKHKQAPQVILNFVVYEPFTKSTLYLCIVAASQILIQDTFLSTSCTESYNPRHIVTYVQDMQATG